MVRAFDFICADFVSKRIVCLCLLSMRGMQSAEKTEASLPSKVVSKLLHILLKHVQPAAPDCVGAPAHPSSPQSCQPAGSPGTVGKGTLCVAGGGQRHRPPNAPSRRGRALCKRSFVPFLLCPLFSINETVPSHHSFSLSTSVTVLWELGQRATLSSSVRYKVKTKTNRQAKNSLQRDTFDPGIFSPIGQLASMA